MGVVIIASFFALVAGLAVGLLVFAIGRCFLTHRSNLTTSLITGFSVASIFVLPASFWVIKAGTQTIIDMDPREGEKRLSDIGLPPNTTSDFCMRYSPTSTPLMAEFGMAEQDFLNWVNANKWPIASLKPSEVFWELPLENGGNISVNASIRDLRQSNSIAEKPVNRGYGCYWVRPDSPRCTYTIIYDLDTNRVHLTHSIL